MKIAFIIPNLAYGGAEKFCIQLCNYLASTNEVFLISLCDHSETMYPIGLLEEKVKLITLGKHPGLNGGLFFRLFRVLKSLGPTVIHAHMAGLLYSSPFILMYRKPTVVYTAHTFVKAEFSVLYRYFYFLLLKLRKIEVIANSLAVSKTVQIAYGKTYNKYIHIGSVDLSVSANYRKIQKEVESYKPTEGTQVFIHLARIAPVKNQILLYQTFLQLFEEGYDAILLVLGHIESQSIFQRLEMLKHPRIHYLGNKKDIADYLATADAFCLTSEYEGLSLATIESMSMKVIPICTPAGGVEEVVKDGYNGFISSDHTVNGYLEALKHYLALNDQDKEIMCKNALYTYKKRFTIERCGEEYLQLCKDSFNT